MQLVRKKQHSFELVGKEEIEIHLQSGIDVGIHATERVQYKVASQVCFLSDSGQAPRKIGILGIVIFNQAGYRSIVPQPVLPAKFLLSLIASAQLEIRNRRRTLEPDLMHNPRNAANHKLC